MPKYNVGVYEERSGYIIVEAKSKAQARKIALEYVDYFGLDDHKRLDITYRDYYIVDEPKKLN